MSDVNRASCLVMNNDKLLLVRTKKEKCWQLPGGIPSPKESEEDAALKYTELSSGVKARIIQQFGSYEYQKQGKNFEESVFEADIPSENSSEIKADENFEAKWFDLIDARKETLCPELQLVFEDI